MAFMNSNLNSNLGGNVDYVLMITTNGYICYNYLLEIKNRTYTSSSLDTSTSATISTPIVSMVAYSKSYYMQITFLVDCYIMLKAASPLYYFYSAGTTITQNMYQNMGTVIVPI